MNWTMIVLILTLCLVRVTISELESQLFDLPSLNVQTDQLYLHKKFSTNLSCELSAGYSEARMESVIWIKDKEIISQNDTEYTYNGSILTVHGTRPHNEGEYQCLAEINRIRLSNRQLIRTTIISSPLKIRRARFTKFDETLVNHAAITVRENEVARLPCAGMPDVIPSPASICFQRLENEDDCLGSKNDTKYFITDSGMQISLVTPSDAGFYHCLVRNEYLNQTKKSPKPVLIIVTETNSTEKATPELIKPVLVYPAKETTLDKPIELAVAEGEDVILECVINMAKIVWIKHNDTTPNVTMDDNTSRFQQIWGNLKIRSVALGDAGIYSCLGLPIVGWEGSHDHNKTRPRIDYNLVVYSPSGVRLSITSQFDKRYLLECLATNLRYEIPTAYINGTSIVHNINEMGIPSNTNFYNNPIRVHMEVKTTFTGSIQCVSRPAMVEAEIYGYGLERGKSMNMFVMNNLNSNDLIIKGPTNITVPAGQTADFPCIVTRVKARSWMKNNRTLSLFTARRTIIGSNSLRISKVELSDEGMYTCVAQSESGQTSYSSAYLTVTDDSTTKAPVVTSTEPFLDKKKDMKIDVEDVRGFVTGTEVRIQWSVLGKMEALTKIARFSIEAQSFGSAEDSWIEAESVDSHVRATTIKSLIPDNKYKFRIKMIRDDGTHVLSLPTEWMNVEATSGDVLPLAPKILSVYQRSSETAKVLFSHNVLIENAAAKTFVIIYNEVSSDQNKSQVTQVDGSQNEAIITGLTFDTQYSIRAIAENSAGKSVSSGEYLFNTTR
uniref:Vascular endothelial growth factor receptor 2 n=2 Tax=Caenorhabditis tropicalis TaxID=1561998 RepID=A0A1I7TR68_9PELO